MKIIATLLSIDRIQFFRWLKKDTSSKLFVLFGFLSIFLFVSFGIYTFSFAFFRNLASYTSFGILTGGYLLHAAIILILWFAIGSSISATLTSLVSSDHTKEYMLLLPVRPILLTCWMFIRTMIANSILLGFVLFPLALAFFQVFNTGSIETFLLQFFYTLFVLVLLSGSVGGIIAYCIAGFIHGRERGAITIGIIVFLLISYLLLKTIFPPALRIVYDATPEEFSKIFVTLPLQRQLFPTRWLAETLSTGFGMSALYLGLLTTVWVIIALSIESRELIPLTQRLRGKAFATKRTVTSFTRAFLWHKHPLILKDWLSILRTRSETGYAMFLLSIMVFFFLFLWKATTLRGINQEYVPNLTVFIFVWLLFFTTAYLLRLVFPLMAREGPSPWYILTMPIRRITIFTSKLFLGLFLLTPLVIFSFLLWTGISFTRQYMEYLIVLSLIGMIGLSGLQTVLGSVRPNYTYGHDPEKISTSLTGIGSLILSSVWIGLLCLLLKVLIH
jgi:hypothetical protein